MAWRWLVVTLGGGLGSLCRYALSALAGRLFGTAFAWGTLLVNGLGCFLLGCAFALADQRQLIPPAGRLFFMVGFLGAFTTFSTYALECVNFARQGQFWIALSNIVTNNLVGLAMIVIGFWIAQNL